MTDTIDRIPTPPPVAPLPAAGAAPARAESPAFRALLDSLERLARSSTSASAVTDTDSLKRAIVDADDGFQQAMDLRRRLEDAFRERSV